MRSWWVLFTLAWCVAAAADDGFGRLFSTPLERQSIDRVRETGVLPASMSAPSVDAVNKTAPPKAATNSVILKGVVIRDRGNSVAWINNQSNLSAPISADDLRVDNKHINKDGATIVLGGKAIQLKPGQVYDPDSGATQELYQNRAKMPLPRVAGAASAGANSSIVPDHELNM